MNGLHPTSASCSKRPSTARRAVLFAFLFASSSTHATPPAARPPLDDRACGEALTITTPPPSLIGAISRFNAADRKGGKQAFVAARKALDAVTATDNVTTTYVALVRAITHARYVEGRAELERLRDRIGALDAKSRCRLRALSEHATTGVELHGVFAYDSTSIQRLAERDPRRVGEMNAIFSTLGEVFHAIGARRHFFALTYAFVDAFEPIRGDLPDDLAAEVNHTLTTFGRQHMELFGDLPSSGRPTTE